MTPHLITSKTFTITSVKTANAFTSKYEVKNLTLNAHWAIDFFREEDVYYHINNLKRIYSEFCASDEIEELSSDQETDIACTFRVLLSFLRGIKQQQEYNQMMASSKS